MDDSSARDLIDRYVAAYNRFDVDGMLSLLHEDVEFRNVSDGETTVSTSGLEEFRALAEQSKALFTARRQEVTAFQLDGDTARVDISYEAVLASDLPNGMRAGDTLQLQGRSEFGFRNGRIARIVDRVGSE